MCIFCTLWSDFTTLEGCVHGKRSLWSSESQRMARVVPTFHNSAWDLHRPTPSICNSGIQWTYTKFLACGRFCSILLNPKIEHVLILHSHCTCSKHVTCISVGFSWTKSFISVNQNSQKIYFWFEQSISLSCDMSVIFLFVHEFLYVLVNQPLD